MSVNEVLTERQDDVLVVTLNRPDVRNAVNAATARQLADAFIEFDHNDALSVAVFHGAHGSFCAGADLKALSAGRPNQVAALEGEMPYLDGRAPMGPTYLRLSKPVIAAISGHAVAGGMELALWCDLRVIEEDAVFGVFCRRWGVPLIDGGTVRLPRLIGHSRAMDLILTGRPVAAEEALAIGLANRVVPVGGALAGAIELAQQIARYPQLCLRNDRRSAYEQWDLGYEQAMANENSLGRAVLSSGETLAGATRFADGKGRGGSFEDI